MNLRALCQNQNCVTKRENIIKQEVASITIYFINGFLIMHLNKYSLGTFLLFALLQKFFFLVVHICKKLFNKIVYLLTKYYFCQPKIRLFLIGTRERPFTNTMHKNFKLRCARNKIAKNKRFIKSILIFMP